MIAAKMPTHSVFYFDRVAPGTLELARKSRERGALVVFEPSGIKEEGLFLECLKASHIVKYANDRIESIHAFVTKAKVPIEIETMGAKGLRLCMPTNSRPTTWKELPAFPAVNLRDASGAGDWTTAGIIHELMSECKSANETVADFDTVVGATRKGQALASLNCGFEGARGLMYSVGALRTLELSKAIVSGISVTNDQVAFHGVDIASSNTILGCRLCSS
jgi:fructokinase